MFIIFNILTTNQENRKRAGFPFLDTDLEWDSENLLAFPVVAVAAGLVAAMLGIGGGMVQGPLFMIYNMEPRVATATCAFSIWFTSISSVSQYFFAGHIGFQFFFYFFCFGFISGIIGQNGVDILLNRIKRPRYVEA